MSAVIRVLVCTHKEAELPRHEYFYPIQAGTEVSPVVLPYQADNTGEHISFKNPNFCELTAHYWAWKNLQGTDIIGLNHYRRYFDFRSPRNAFRVDRTFVRMEEFVSHAYKFPDLEKLLQEYDIVLPNHRNHPYDLTTQYAIFHITEDWEVLKTVIEEVSPEYMPAFRKVMSGNVLSNYNMFITSWKHFDGYSDWLFRILFETEKRIHLSAYPNQARVFGYMAERLINVYCEHHRLRRVYFPVVMPLEDYRGGGNPTNFRYRLRWLKNDVRYWLSKSK